MFIEEKLEAVDQLHLPLISREAIEKGMAEKILEQCDVDLPIVELITQQTQ